MLKSQIELMNENNSYSMLDFSDFIIGYPTLFINLNELEWEFLLNPKWAAISTGSFPLIQDIIQVL
jgi:hypothetical protein